MSVSFNATAKRYTHFVKPAGTTQTTLYTAAAGIVSSTIESLVIACGGTGDTATVVIHDGTTDWAILTTKSVTASTTETYELGNPVLKPGHSIKVTSGVGNRLTYMLTVAEVMPSMAMAQ